MAERYTRRDFFRNTNWSRLGAGLVAAIKGDLKTAPRKPVIRIALSESSLQESLRSGQLDHLDFAVRARQDYGIGLVEYASTFFHERKSDIEYLSEMKRRADDQAVLGLQIQIEEDGALGHPEEIERRRAVDTYREWVETATLLGCLSIRIRLETLNMGSFEEQEDRAADGLWRLAEFAASGALSVRVENGRGISGNGAWLAGVIRKVNLPNCGVALQMGGGALDESEDYIRIVSDLQPFAKSVNANLGPDGTGENLQTDYARALKFALGSDLLGYASIQYEGSHLPEPDGIRATKRLLENVSAAR